MSMLLGFIGLPELAILLVIILLLFGTRLPSLMRSMGQGVVEFKKGLNDGDKPPVDEVEVDKESAPRKD